MTQIRLVTVLTGGLIDGINPCAFSVLLSFVAVVLASVAVTNASLRVWRIGVIYIFGMFVSYLLLGLGIIGLIAPLVRVHLAVRLIGLTVVVLGLWTLKDAFYPNFRPALAMPKASYSLVRTAMRWSGPWGALAVGGLVGLCAFPCSGAIYVGTLSVIATAPLLERLGYLVLYNLMFITPLIALLVMIANRANLNRISHWAIHRRTLSRLVLGSATIVLGFSVLLTA